MDTDANLECIEDRLNIAEVPEYTPKELYPEAVTKLTRLEAVGATLGAAALGLYAVTRRNRLVKIAGAGLIAGVGLVLEQGMCVSRIRQRNPVTLSAEDQAFWDQQSSFSNQNTTSQ